MSAGVGPQLVRIGLGVTVAGLVLGVIALLPLVTSLELPSAFWFLAMLLGVGIGLILAGLFAQGRRRGRLQRSAVAPVGSSHTVD
jgi:hypothetical protein